MHVEKLKYIIWAKDMSRAVRFYTEVFEGKVTRASEVITDVEVAGVTIGIHGGGEGNRTWTGMSFQVGDLLGAVEIIRAAGGSILREPEDTPEEPAHLAMCVDPEGNEFMLTRKRHSYSSK
jgi:predicted enzyme related to lactoylglutathione lyase